MILLTWSGFGLAACGPATQAAPGPADPGDGTSEQLRVAAHGTGDGRGERRHQHREFTPELSAYHDVMWRLWHAPPGSNRADKTCAKAGELVARARTLAAALAPGPAAARLDEWHYRARVLVVANEQLQAACRGSRAGTERRLEDVHDAFYQLIRLLTPDVQHVD